MKTSLDLRNQFLKYLQYWLALAQHIAHILVYFAPGHYLSQSLKTLLLIAIIWLKYVLFFLSALERKT